MKWDGIEGTVKLFSKNSGRWKLLFEDREDLKKSYINQWKNYVNFLNDKKSNIVSGEEALKVLSLVEEVKKNSLLKNVKEKKWK